VPAYLRLCAPWLEPAEVKLLQRAEPRAWTVSDLPLLDAARLQLGDPEESRRRQRLRAAAEAEREERDQVMEHLIASDDSDMQVMSMLKVHDLQAALVDEGAVPAADPDLLAGPFAHVVVDEAQELTDAEWQMLLQRCPSRSFTIVGDRAQARNGFPESWAERLDRVGFTSVELAHLELNYRTPAEVMEAAEPVIRAVLPDANVPTSIRPGGHPVRYGSTAELDAVVDGWLAEHAEGTACIIRAGAGDSAGGGVGDGADLPEDVRVRRQHGGRVRALTPELAKGLEFDLVVLVDPDEFGSGVAGAVDHYVAMTRATQQLVVLTSG
jgi:superfamily I DNA/RNA helicase